jgi:hypothetical protein
LRLQISEQEEVTSCQIRRIGRLEHTDESIFFRFSNRQPGMMWLGVVYVQVGSCDLQFRTTKGQACNKTRSDSFNKELRIMFLSL